jgi:signal transduction histidine kinase
MGLAIARGLLTAERGTLAAANVEGGGACFSIHIPGRMRPSAQPS